MMKAVEKVGEGQVEDLDRCFFVFISGTERHSPQPHIWKSQKSDEIGGSPN